MQYPKKLRDGDLFSVKLEEEKYAIGIVIHSSKIFKMAVLISIYDMIFSSPSDFDALRPPNKMVIGESKDLPNYTGKAAITKGFWHYIGNFPSLLENIEQPIFMTPSSFYLRDEIVKDVPENYEVKTLVFHGYEAVENLLKKHFGLSH